MISLKKSYLTVLATLVLSSFSTLGFCQVPGTPAAGSPATTGTASSTTETATSLRGEITSALEAAEANKAADPEAEAPTAASDLLNQALEKLNQRDQYTSETEQHRRAIREAPAMLERVQAELKLDESTSASAVDLASTATAEIAAQQLETTKAELQGLETSLEEINAEQQRRTTRMGEIPRELTEARQELSQAEIAANVQAASDEDPAIALARLLLARASIQAAQARITSLEEEMNRYNARESLLPQARQLVNQRIAAKQSVLKLLENKVAELRREEATESARELTRAAANADQSHPLVQAVASENTSVTKKLNLEEVVKQHDKAVDKLENVRDSLARVSEQYVSLKSKFEAVGFSDALGILLRKQRKELPDIRSHRESLEQMESTLAAVNLKSLEIQDILTDLASPVDRANAIVSQANLDETTTSPEQVRTEIVTLLRARQEYLTKIRDANDSLFQTLIELNTAEEELVQQASEFQDYIDQRILWLPSDDRLSPTLLALGLQYFGSLLQPDLWVSYLQSYHQQVNEHPVLFILGALAVLLVVAFHRRWKTGLHKNLEIGRRNRLANFRPVIQALVFAGLYALFVPVVVFVIGWPLANSFHVPAQVSSLAAGLVYGAIALFLLQFARRIIRKNGIASTYFAWPEPSLLKLRRALALLVWVYVPVIVMTRAADLHSTSASMEAARITLVIALLTAAGAIGWLLLPRRSVFIGTQSFKNTNYLYKLRYPLFVLAVGIPVALAAAAIMGYVYTAIELSQRLHVTFWAGVSLLLLNEVVFFWILVKRRRLAIDEARKRREAAKAAAREGEATVNPDGVAPPEPTIDIAGISQQAGRLLRVFILGMFVLALWGIWAGVLPALRYLDSQPLWSVSRQITETLSDGTVQSVDRLVPVTVADMLLVMLVLFGAVAALRNIPGLLDITVFQRFSVQSGERYAFNTLIRYVIIILGVIYVSYLMGLQWRQIQWLAAAVSVGLGFGLQEIFANFVSGLILLFERPVRVGDFVRVGDIKGNITQIRIRATTVIDWDHFEHIIPNKEMITKSVENWTLSNLRRRLVIHVGVPYGCDYDQARSILIKVCEENPYVMDDPGPAAGIEQLADSAVVFVVFAHLPNSDSFLDARHTLIAEFERKLSAVGIPIPFPQLDVHLEQPKGPGEQKH